MAIGAATGGTASNSSAGTSLAFAAYAATAGRDILVAVALANTSCSVSTITDTAGNTYTLKSATANGSAVRVEIWQAQYITGNASNVINIAITGGSSLMAACREEYTGTLNGGFSSLTRSGWSASADSNYGGGYLPANLLDGSPNNVWISGSAAPPHWFVIDMGASKTFDTIQLVTRNDGYNSNQPKQYDVYVSDDGSTWGSSIGTFNDPADQGVAHNHQLGATYTKRYIKINITQNWSGNEATCGEFYAGTTVSPATQNTATATSDTTTGPHVRTSTHDSTGWAVAAIGFACQSGDTISAADVPDTVRQSVVPALTSVGVALVDMSGNGGVPCLAKLSTSRAWAAVGLELRPADGVVVTPALVTPARMRVTRVPVSMPRIYQGATYSATVSSGQVFPTGH